MVRTPCCDREHTRKGTWSREEDVILANYIHRHGLGINWRYLPKSAGLLRCGKSCRLRWCNYLNPNVKRGNFSAAENATIIKLHKEFGNRWSLMAKKLEGRTDNEIKNHWNSNLRRRLLDQGIDPKTHKPLNGKSSAATGSISIGSSVTAITTPPPSDSATSKLVVAPAAAAAGDAVPYSFVNNNNNNNKVVVPVFHHVAKNKNNIGARRNRNKKTDDKGSESGSSFSFNNNNNMKRIHPLLAGAYGNVMMKKIGTGGGSGSGRVSLGGEVWKPVPIIIGKVPAAAAVTATDEVVETRAGLIDLNLPPPLDLPSKNVQRKSCPMNPLEWLKRGPQGQKGNFTPCMNNGLGFKGMDGFAAAATAPVPMQKNLKYYF